MPGISIGFNVAAMSVQRLLDESGRRLAVVQERLSSGLRINYASDDAAGLAVASQLKACSRIYSQAIRNANDGMSAINIASGALSELSAVLMRLKELSSQAANGTLSLTQRLSLDSEANQLTLEFNRIIGSTVFNGRNLLNGTFGRLCLQLGWGSNSILEATMGGELSRNVGTGTFKSPVTIGAATTTLIASGDFNNDGKLDFIDLNGANAYLNLGNGDGTFSAPTLLAAEVSGASASNIAVGDVNGDGNLDVLWRVDATGDFYLRLGNGNGTFQSANSVLGSSTYDKLQLADINGDGRDDMLGISGNTIKVALAQSNNTFLYYGSYTSLTGLSGYTTGDFNGDGRLDMAATGTNAIGVMLGAGDGSFGAVISQTLSFTPSSFSIGDFNHDGKLDLAAGGTSSANIFFGAGTGSFQSPVSYACGGNTNNQLKSADINGDGYLDIISGATQVPVGGRLSVIINNGDGTFAPELTTSAATPTNYLVGDFNGDSVLDILAAGSYPPNLFEGNKTQTNSIQRYNLTTQSEARRALTLLDTALKNIENEIAALGALQSRLESALRTIFDSRENYLAAGSRITDADIAEETSALVRLQILQRTGVAVLAQANFNPSIALQLLGV